MLPARQRVLARKCVFFQPRAVRPPPDGAAVAAPHRALRGALLRGEPTEALQIVQGPPARQVARAQARVARLGFGRAFVARRPTWAPRSCTSGCCARRDGAAVQPVPRARARARRHARRATTRRRASWSPPSRRASPRLHAQALDAVFLDEAGQCAEACADAAAAEVAQLTLAGDVKQLRATASSTGAAPATTARSWSGSWRSTRTRPRC